MGALLMAKVRYMPLSRTLTTAQFGIESEDREHRVCFGGGTLSTLAEALVTDSDASSECDVPDVLGKMFQDYQNVHTQKK